MTPEQHITDIAAVLAAHERYYVHGDDHDRCSGCRWVGDSDEHRAHAAAEIVKAEAAARRIDTVEQLDAYDYESRDVPLPATLLWSPADV